MASRQRINYRGGFETKHRAGFAKDLGAPLSQVLISNSMEQIMTVVSEFLIGVVAILHVYFLILEMFLWDKPYGLKAFGLTPEFAAASKALAANQGLYNGFLAAGLLWSLLLGASGESVKIFFLNCVIVAGVFGGVTVSRKILFVQALPAVIALGLVLLN